MLVTIVVSEFNQLNEVMFYNLTALLHFLFFNHHSLFLLSHLFVNRNLLKALTDASKKGQITAIHPQNKFTINLKQMHLNNSS